MSIYHKQSTEKRAIAHFLTFVRYSACAELILSMRLLCFTLVMSLFC